MFRIDLEQGRHPGEGVRTHQRAAQRQRTDGRESEGHGAHFRRQRHVATTNRRTEAGEPDPAHFAAAERHPGSRHQLNMTATFATFLSLSRQQSLTKDRRFVVVSTILQ